MPVLVLPVAVALTGLPVASTGLLEVPTVELPAVLDRLGAMLPELLWPLLLVELLVLVAPAIRLPVAVVPAGVVWAWAAEPARPAMATNVKSFLIMMSS